MKVIPRGELIAPRLAEFATACGKGAGASPCAHRRPDRDRGLHRQGPRPFDEALTGVRRQLRGIRPPATIYGCATRSRAVSSRARLSNSPRALVGASGLYLHFDFVALTSLSTAVFTADTSPGIAVAAVN